MREELKKYYIHYRWLLIILLFIAIKLFTSLILFDTSDDISLLKYDKQYFEVLERYSGTLTDEKEQALFAEFDEINQAVSQASAVDSQLLGGRITAEEYDARLEELKPVTSKQQGFMLVFEQYQYVFGDKENRQLIFTRGWEKLFDSQSLDWLLTVLIVLLVSQMFAREYETGMSQILLPAKKGRKALCAKKLAICLATSLILTVIFTAVDIFSAARIGLGNFSAPLQSLSVYSRSPRNISLIEALALTSVLKVFGYVFFAVIVLLISAFTKKLLPTLCISLGAMLMQTAAFGESNFKYKYAQPYGFMISNGYLKGSDTGDNPVFIALTTSELVTTVTVSLMVFAVLCVLSVFMFSTGGKVKLRKKAAVTALCLPVLLLSGCSSDSEDYTAKYYKSKFSNYAENSQFIFYTSFNDQGLIIDKQTGEECEFVLDPFFGGGTMLSKPFVTEESAYYVRNNALYLEVVHRDLNDMSEEVIYKSGSEQRRLFLGLGKTDGSGLLSFTVNDIYVNDKYIYLSTVDHSNNYAVLQINRLTSSAREIVTDLSVYGSFFDGTDIYYIATDYSLKRYDAQKDKVEKFIADRVNNFIFTDNAVFYANIVDGYKLYMCGRNGENPRKVSDNPVKEFATDNEHLYYVASRTTTGPVYRVSLDGTGEELFYDGNGNEVLDVEAFANYGKLFVRTTDGNGNYFDERIEK